VQRRKVNKRPLKFNIHNYGFQNIGCSVDVKEEYLFATVYMEKVFCEWFFHRIRLNIDLQQRFSGSLLF
jgi:hypothetical protein